MKESNKYCYGSGESFYEKKLVLNMCMKDPNCYGVSSRYCDYDSGDFEICSFDDHVSSGHYRGCIYRKGSYP